MFIGYLFLAVPSFAVREASVNLAAMLRQKFLHACRIEVQRIHHIPEVAFFIPVAAL